MSTKIHHGYVSNLGLVELLHEFRKLVKQFEELKEREYTKHLVTTTVHKMDYHYATGKFTDGSTQINYLNIQDSKYRKKIEEYHPKSQRCPDIDFTASCSVFPLYKDKTLILFYQDNEFVLKLWQDLPFIYGHSYQDQTDKPNNISSEEWAIRENEWEEALANDIPRNRGYLFTFTDHFLDYDQDKLNENIPSDDKRATHLLKELYIEKKIVELRGDDGDKKDIDNIWSIIRQATDLWLEYRETDAFKAEVIKTISKLQKIDFK